MPMTLDRREFPHYYYSLTPVKKVTRQTVTQ